MVLVLVAELLGILSWLYDLSIWTGAASPLNSIPVERNETDFRAAGSLELALDCMNENL